MSVELFRLKLKIEMERSKEGRHSFLECTLSLILPWIFDIQSLKVIFLRCFGWADVSLLLSASCRPTRHFYDRSVKGMLYFLSFTN